MFTRCRPLGPWIWIPSYPGCQVSALPDGILHRELQGGGREKSQPQSHLPFHPLRAPGAGLQLQLVFGFHRCQPGACCWPSRRIPLGVSRVHGRDSGGSNAPGQRRSGRPWGQVPRVRAGAAGACARRFREPEQWQAQGTRRPGGRSGLAGPRGRRAEEKRPARLSLCNTPNLAVGMHFRRP